MAATLTLRVYTGSGAGTESSAQAGIDLISADNATNSSGNRTANQVVPGTNSYEKWLRLRVDSAPTGSVATFWFQNDDDLPDGVVLKLGATDTPATPTTATSTVATTTVQTGQRYIFDADAYSDVGDHTRYLVLQEQVAATAASGSIDQLVPAFGWQES
jgi:hypothetical protein